VATPHGLDFAKAADLYGCDYGRPYDLGELEAAVVRSVTEGRTSIIEVRTDRGENLALHRRITAAATAESQPSP
jgi:2-succinyl-5-enolpyruvyl-6-hydroxy-3-cyclohexene-1-carboxylate synthase